MASIKNINIKYCLDILEIASFPIHYNRVFGILDLSKYDNPHQVRQAVGLPLKFTSIIKRIKAFRRIKASANSAAFNPIFRSLFHKFSPFIKELVRAQPNKMFKHLKAIEQTQVNHRPNLLRNARFNNSLRVLSLQVGTLKQNQIFGMIKFVKRMNKVQLLNIFLLDCISEQGLNCHSIILEKIEYLKLKNPDLEIQIFLSGKQSIKKESFSRILNLTSFLHIDKTCCTKVSQYSTQLANFGQQLQILIIGSSQNWIDKTIVQGACQRQCSIQSILQHSSGSFSYDTFPDRLYKWVSLLGNVRSLFLNLSDKKMTLSHFNKTFKYLRIPLCIEILGINVMIEIDSIEQITPDNFGIIDVLNQLKGLKNFQFLLKLNEKCIGGAHQPQEKYCLVEQMINTILINCKKLSSLSLDLQLYSGDREYCCQEPINLNKVFQQLKRRKDLQNFILKTNQELDYFHFKREEDVCTIKQKDNIQVINSINELESHNSQQTNSLQHLEITGKTTHFGLNEAFESELPSDSCDFISSYALLDFVKNLPVTLKSLKFNFRAIISSNMLIQIIKALKSKPRLKTLELNFEFQHSINNDIPKLQCFVKKELKDWIRSLAQCKISFLHSDFQAIFCECLKDLEIRNNSFLEFLFELALLRKETHSFALKVVKQKQQNGLYGSLYPSKEDILTVHQPTQASKIFTSQEILSKLKLSVEVIPQEHGQNEVSLPVRIIMPNQIELLKMRYGVDCLIIFRVNYITQTGDSLDLFINQTLRSILLNMTEIDRVALICVTPFGPKIWHKFKKISTSEYLEKLSEIINIEIQSFQYYEAQCLSQEIITQQTFVCIKNIFGNKEQNQNFNFMIWVDDLQQLDNSMSRDNIVQLKLTKDCFQLINFFVEKKSNYKDSLLQFFQKGIQQTQHQFKALEGIFGTEEQFSKLYQDYVNDIFQCPKFRIFAKFKLLPSFKNHNVRLVQQQQKSYGESVPLGPDFTFDIESPLFQQRQKINDPCCRYSPIAIKGNADLKNYKGTLGFVESFLEYKDQLKNIGSSMITKN